MRVRAILLAAVVVLVAFAYAMRGPQPGASARPPEGTPPAAPAGLPPVPVPEREVPARNVFEYGDTPRLPSGPVPRPAAPPRTLAVPAPEPPAPVRLVGLLRRGGALRAALSIHGDLVVLAEGETGGGYTVVGIDEDEGVTLRDPQGGALRLPLPVD